MAQTPKPRKPIRWLRAIRESCDRPTFILLVLMVGGVSIWWMVADEPARDGAVDTLMHGWLPVLGYFVSVVVLGILLSKLAGWKYRVLNVVAAIAAMLPVVVRPWTVSFENAVLRTIPDGKNDQGYTLTFATGQRYPMIDEYLPDYRLGFHIARPEWDDTWDGVRDDESAFQWIRVGIAETGDLDDTTEYVFTARIHTEWDRVLGLWLLVALSSVLVRECTFNEEE